MRSVLSFLRTAAYGVLMGSADIIPGVSGGTMALIVGIYERLVGAISTLVSLGVSLLRFDTGDFRRYWSRVPWGFLLSLGVGIGAAIVVGARVIPALLQTHPHTVNGAFLGLVAASLLVPALRIERMRLGYVLLAGGCAVGAFVLTGLPLLAASAPSLPRVFASAAVAICAMILPGISGAFLLKAMGVYAPTLEALNTLDLPYIATFCLGAAAGLGGFAKLLDWLLDRYHDATMAALVGLIAGALRALWPYTTPDRALRLPLPDEPVAPVVLVGVAGFVAVLTLVWWGSQRETPAHTSDRATA
jgi:putative membrane protein